MSAARLGQRSGMSPEPTLSTIPLVSTRHAACSCEQLRLTVEGEPVRVSICHCLACQRRTGSVFGVQARFDAEQVTIEGRSRQYIRVSDDGEKCAFHFCPDCGATVFYAPETSPGIVAVPVGAFADPSFPAPTRSVWEERRHSGGPRDAPERQQALRATIAWSHDLLSADEQRLFARLSAFAGGCTLEAAETVCAADLDVLESLVDKSLVRRSGDRFWMLETIRESALERLGGDRWRRGPPGHRHTAYFLELVELAKPELHAAPELVGLVRPAPSEA
jgi:hypothetical protein